MKNHLSPFADRKLRIFAKLMNMLPLGSVKAALAFNMIREKYRSGELEAPVAYKKTPPDVSGGVLKSYSCAGKP